MTHRDVNQARAELRRIAAVVITLPGKVYFAGFSSDMTVRASSVKTSANLADAKFFYPTNPAKINDYMKRLGEKGIVAHPMNVALDFTPYQPYREGDHGQG